MFTAAKSPVVFKKHSLKPVEAESLGMGSNKSILINYCPGEVDVASPKFKT